MKALYKRPAASAQEAGNLALDTMEFGSMTALKFFVESGLGIALVPKIIAEPVTTGTTIRVIHGSLIYMREQSA